MTDAPIEEFWRVITLDLFGTFLGCPVRHSGNRSLGRRRSGEHGVHPCLDGISGRDCYASAKGSVASLTRSLAVEYAAKKVRVNAIAPSVTRSPRVHGLLAANPALH